MWAQKRRFPGSATGSLSWSPRLRHLCSLRCVRQRLCATGAVKTAAANAPPAVAQPVRPCCLPRKRKSDNRASRPNVASRPDSGTRAGAEKVSRTLASPDDTSILPDGTVGASEIERSGIHKKRAVAGNVSVCHARGVEGEAGISVAVEKDEATGGLRALGEEIDRFACGEHGGHRRVSSS
jgi:hypothetical protein